MCNGHICGIRDKFFLFFHLFHSKLALLKYHARFLTWIKHIEKLITTLETLITRKSKNVCTLSNQINRFQWLNQYRVSSWKSKVFFLCVYYEVFLSFAFSFSFSFVANFNDSISFFFIHSNQYTFVIQVDFREYEAKAMRKSIDGWGCLIFKFCNDDAIH